MCSLVEQGHSRLQECGSVCIFTFHVRDDLGALYQALPRSLACPMLGALNKLCPRSTR